MSYAGNPFDPVVLWTVIIGVAVGSFVLRFVFVGLVGSRAMPEWLLRHLRYTAVAMLPALVAPMVLFPDPHNGGGADLPRIAAAFVALAVGYFSKNVIAAISCAAATLYGLLYLLG